MTSKEIGNLGEKIAENYLKDKEYKILDKNYSFLMPGNPKKGEIDIIAKKEDAISFIEVKTLKTSDYSPLFSPEEKVDFKKRFKLVKTAESWLMKNKIPLDSKWQIDVIAILIKDGEIKISHFENAIPSC